MQGANAVVAQYEKSLERDQVSILLLRQLKLANVGDSSSLHFNQQLLILNLDISRHWKIPIGPLLLPDVAILNIRHRQSWLGRPSRRDH